jgi:hypothetical protein
MQRPVPSLRIWLPLGLLAAVLVVPLARPLRSAWACYARADAGARAHAEVVSAFEADLVLRLTSGPHEHAACTAKRSETPGEPGDSLHVVYLAERGECIAVATVERSGAVLWALTSGLGCILLLLVAIGLALQRAFVRPALPPRRLDAEPDTIMCPSCGGKMAEGTLVLLAGLHWREPGQPIGLPHALGGLPGTVGWRGRPLLHAFRCSRCEVLTAQYGLPAQRG